MQKLSNEKKKLSGHMHSHPDATRLTTNFEQWKSLLQKCICIPQCIAFWFASFSWVRSHSHLNRTEADFPWKWPGLPSSVTVCWFDPQQNSNDRSYHPKLTILSDESLQGWIQTNQRAQVLMRIPVYCTLPLHCVCNGVQIRLKN